MKDGHTEGVTVVTKDQYASTILDCGIIVWIQNDCRSIRPSLLALVSTSDVTVDASYSSLSYAKQFATYAHTDATSIHFLACMASELLGIAFQTCQSRCYSWQGPAGQARACPVAMLFDSLLCILLGSSYLFCSRPS
jgi:hypothetical protein